MAKIVRRALRWLLALAMLLTLLVAAVSIGGYVYVSRDLPRLRSLPEYRPPLVTQVYARDGQLIARYCSERRYLVSLDQVAPVMVQAIVAAEDDRFYQHRGISLLGIVRAALKNLRSMQIRQGGSTITQQIVKSLLLTPERSYSRKIKEAILALRIERSLSKDEILTLYLNQIYFGRGAYGVEAAARTYFNTTAAELSLGQAAFLAGLPKAPNYYRHPDRADARRRYVLGRMLQQGYIVAEELAQADATPLVFIDEPQPDPAVQWFAEHVRRQLEQQFGADMLYRGGLQVETTMDLRLQLLAQAAIDRGIADYERRQQASDNGSGVEAALLCQDPDSGHVLAMIGGRDPQASKFNRAVQARRQPGSAFKPIIFAAALDKGYTPATIIVDSPLIYKVVGRENEDGSPIFWEPQNYELAFSGPKTLRSALAKSCNIITIKILRDIGVNYVIRYARKLGLEGEFNRDLALSLGTCGVSLERLVTAYASFCAQGVYPEPCYVTRVTDRSGQVLLAQSPRLMAALSPQTAYLMTSLLESVVREGTGWRARTLRRPCAGKTGTTNDVRDAWFMGYTPEIVTGVWVGFDDQRPLGTHETGSRAASPIWVEFMQGAHEGLPARPFRVPLGIVYQRIDPRTGYYPASVDVAARYECFKEGTVPTLFRPDQLPRMAR